VDVGVDVSVNVSASVRAKARYWELDWDWSGHRPTWGSFGGAWATASTGLGMAQAKEGSRWTTRSRAPRLTTFASATLLHRVHATALTTCSLPLLSCVQSQQSPARHCAPHRTPVQTPERGPAALSRLLLRSRLTTVSVSPQTTRICW